MPNYLPVGGAERVSEPSDLDEAVPVSRFAVGGQADVAQMLRQVNEYNMYGDDPEYASESSGVLGELYGVGRGGPSRVEVKRVKGRELEPKTSKGFGKGMAMSLDPLAVGKEGKVGQGNADLLEVARRYKLKARQAENEARGLMRDTFGAPTLEQPTLLRGPLMRKRFSEGGEVEVRSLTRALSGAPESEELRNEAIQAVKRMDDSAVVATANRLVGKSFSSPTIARLMLEKMVGDTTVSVGVVGQGKALPERLSGYTLGAGVPFFGGYLRGDVDVNRGPGSPMYRLGFQKEFADGGEVVSPEEQPVVEESGASRALKEMMAPVREGVKGYFGMEPGVAGGEAYRAGQALSNMPGAGAPSVLGIFIGKGAKSWNKASNEAAKRLSKQGATPDEVWQATGNFKGPDGQWRQEISDQASRHRGQVSQGPAGMVFEHPELYANYPELKDILVRTNPYETKSSLTGGGQPGAVINLGTAGGKAENARGMLHELQHDIQYREGFGLGGSSALAFNDPQAFKILEEIRAQVARPLSLEEFAKDAWKTDKVTPEIQKGYKNYLDYRKTHAKEIDIEAQKTAARIYYERLLGEAEARAVEDRRLFTPQERRLLLPSQSYRRDGGREVIPLDQLIIRRSEGGPVDTSTARAQLATLKAA